MELTTAVKGFVKQAPEQQNLFVNRKKVKHRAILWTSL
jgi:hypothetical protein